MQEAASPVNNPFISVLAYIIPPIILILSFLLSLERNPTTGGITINPFILILGVLVAAFLFIALIPKRPTGIPKRPYGIPTRPCINCGNPIPLDGIFCPYCGFNHHNK